MIATFVDYFNAFPFSSLENASSEEEWKDLNTEIRKELLPQSGGYIRDILVEEIERGGENSLLSFPKIKDTLIRFLEENRDVIPQEGDSLESFPSKARVIVGYIRKLKELGLPERLDAAMAA